MKKSEIKERLTDLGIDFTGVKDKDELLALLPTTGNPTDYDPLADVEAIDKEQSQGVNIVADSLKDFMKMVKVRFDWSKPIAVPTDNSLDKNSDIHYTLEIGDKSTFNKVVQPDGSEIKQFTGQVIRVITSTNVNAMLNNGELVESDLMSLKVSRLELMDRNSGTLKPRFFLMKPRAKGFAKKTELNEETAVVTLDIKRVRKSAFQLKA
jgi:hypothetical protein